MAGSYLDAATNLHLKPPSPPTTTIVKFLCSYGGKIIPRHPDGKLRYLGGETRVLAVDRSTPFSELLLKMGELCGGFRVSLRCQLPKEDLDALVSITSDEDLANLVEEYDRAGSSSLKIRAFLSLPKKPSSISSSSSSSSSSSGSGGVAVGSLSSSGGNPPPRYYCHHHLSKQPLKKVVNGGPQYGGGGGGHRGNRVYLVHNGNHWQ